MQVDEINYTEQQYMSALHSQYHACWCSGNFRNQGISSHGIVPQSRNILSSASEELRAGDIKSALALEEVWCWTED